MPPPDAFAAAWDGDDPLAVRQLAERTYALRQHLSITPAAPLCYLLIGSRSALLLDTGAVGPAERNPIRQRVEAILASNGRADHHLIVAHTHTDPDHVSGDHQFLDRPDTTLVGRTLLDVQQFFGFDDWPDDQVTLELGDRELAVLAIPGHHPTHIAVYDGHTGYLFTGDTLLPGRIYGPQFTDLMRSADRLATFARTHPVTAVLGSHIEMTTTAHREFPLGSRQHRDEAPLALPADAVHEFAQRTIALAGRVGRHVFADMIIFNSPGRISYAREHLRGALQRLTRRAGFHRY